MSAELYSVNGPSQVNLQGTTVGGSKPLHRFIKGQPKVIGTIVLVLGGSSFIISIALKVLTGTSHLWLVIPSGLLQGTLFIICGILYILAEHNPTKKTVTASLALSVVSILTSFWTFLQIAPDFGYSHFAGDYDYDENITDTESMWRVYYQTMGLAMEVIIVFYSSVGAIIFIVMSALAGAALHSTKSQAIVVMTTAPTEIPAE